MVYLIIGILLLLLYVFAIPQSIKGTVNIVALVCFFVVLLVLLVLSFQLPIDFLLVIAMFFLAHCSVRDIRLMPVKKDKKDEGS